MKSRLAAAALALFAGILPAFAQSPTKLQADPPATPPTVLDGKVADVPVPDRLIGPKVAFGGHFVVVGGKIVPAVGVSFLVTDLATGKPVALIKQADLEGPIALAPDGKTMAGTAGAAKTDSVVVIDNSNAKIVRTIAAEKKVDQMRFIDSERLLIVSTADHAAAIWNARAGTKIRDFDFGSKSRINQAPIGISPGGRYAAYAADGSLKVVDIKSGQETVLGAFPKREIFDILPHGVAFSADGKEIAVVADAVGRFCGQIWNVEAGTAGPLIDLPAPRQFFYRGPKIEATPDGVGWLFNGEQMLERKTLVPLWKAPEADGGMFAAASALAGNQFMRLEEVGARKRIVAVGVSKDMLAEATRIARANPAKPESGGRPRPGRPERPTMPGVANAPEVELPELKPSDIASARKWNLPAAGVAWKDSAARGPDTSEFAVRPIPIEMGGPGHSPEAVEFGALAGIAALEFGNSFRGKTVDSYDLTTGRKVGHLALPPRARLSGLAPDGKSILVLDEGDRERVDLYNFDGAAAVGWRPYAGTANESERWVKFAAPLDGGRAITLNHRGVLALWTVPACKALAVIELPNIERIRLSPDRKYLAVLAENTPRLFDAMTLRPAGDADPAGVGRIQASHGGIAFRADGAEFAALVEVTRPPDFRLRWLALRWDARTGRYLGETELPLPPGLFAGGDPALQYAGKYLLLNRQVLIDPANGRNLWNYGAAGRHAMGEAIDDRLWYFAATEKKAGNLVAARVPEPEAQRYIERIEKGEDALLKAGSKIELRESVEGEGQSLLDKGAESLRKRGAESLGRAGYELAGDSRSADAVLTLTLSESDTGKSAPYKLTGIGAGAGTTVDVRLYELKAEAKLRIGNTLVWESAPATMGMNLFMFSMPAGETDVPKYLRKSMWSAGTSWAAGLALPRSIVKSADGPLALPGSSLLKADGPQAQVPLALKKDEPKLGRPR